MKIVSKKKIMKKSGFFGRLAPRRNNTASASHPLDRINREINILKKLDHPNIVKLAEVLDDPVQDNLYLGNIIVQNTLTSNVQYWCIFYLGIFT
jgi:hypothetical protein